MRDGWRRVRGDAGILRDSWKLWRLVELRRTDSGRWEEDDDGRDSGW